ncbi:copper amine oxidase N-terminal domain-containing protein [Paenibacillus sp. FJAT-27812]|uniref:copper amine oxidase N-terminal domain-containing protein n=1 Tax=Paenibacillus sp. FJAT-27812 TaxID=1684143 RepID=UPI0006A7C645|nr:copper amine oxidase N-terminal domain-containing protein [Paenibacillus sp. FJAT-27812]
MKKSRVLSIFLAIMMLSSALATVASAATTTIKATTQPIKLQFDGQALQLPDGQYSFIYEGRTYVPIRYISYALQKTVNWDGGKATISEPTEKELAALKKQLQSAASGSPKPQASVEITIQPVKATLVFDGKTAALPAGQSIYGYKGSIYAPLRFLSESVGTQISFDPVTKTVSGESAAYRAEQGAGGGVVLPGTGGGTGGTGNNAGNGNTGGNAGNGGAGGGVVKPTSEQITAEAESKLKALKASCDATLKDIGMQYILASTAEEKAKLKESGRSEVNKCSASFEVIMTDTTSKLTTNGYSTSIIASYREAFNKDIEDLKAIVAKTA